MSTQERGVGVTNAMQPDRGHSGQITDTASEAPTDDVEKFAFGLDGHSPRFGDEVAGQHPLLVRALPGHFLIPHQSAPAPRARRQDGPFGSAVPQRSDTPSLQETQGPA